jgi:Inner membrane protein CreD
MRRLIAIALVWLGCSVAWMILGSTLLVRSGETSSRLGDDVSELWGPPMRQLPPSATALLPEDQAAPAGPRVPARPVDPGAPYAAPSLPRTAGPTPPIPLVGSEIQVALALQHRQKGLVWFPTYSVSFSSRYTFENPTAEVAEASFEFPLEAEHALYDGFDVLGADGSSVGATVDRGVARWHGQLGPHQKVSYQVRYKSRGTTRWQYDLTSGTGNVKNFALALDTDFTSVDFSPGTLSPSSHAASGGRWHGDWDFKTLVASSPIGVDLPQKLNPGPLASRITFFAPVSLLFFFFVVAILAEAREKKLHPLHYFFFGMAFFAFHLLFSYLVDHVSVFPSFAIASAVSVFLVVSYARLFVGSKFALREMGVAQLIYLVLFSFSFFWTGFTGLAITIGAILTLFVLMQITGRKKLVAGDDASAAAVCAQPYRCAAVAEGRR